MKEDINLDIDVKVANKDVKVANKTHDCVFYTVAGKKYCYICGKVK
jgi:hypothetical protein